MLLSIIPNYPLLNFMVTTAVYVLVQMTSFNPTVFVHIRKGIAENKFPFKSIDISFLFRKETNNSFKAKMKKQKLSFQDLHK